MVSVMKSVISLCFLNQSLQKISPHVGLSLKELCATLLPLWIQPLEQQQQHTSLSSFFLPCCKKDLSLKTITKLN